jgi:predicted transcriptional regulator
MAMSANGSMATKKPQVTAYVTDEVNRALDQVSASERRSRSQMAALLIEEALAARGFQFTDQEGETDSKPDSR